MSIVYALYTWRRVRVPLLGITYKRKTFHKLDGTFKQAKARYDNTALEAGKVDGKVLYEASSVPDAAYWYYRVLKEEALDDNA